MNSKERDATEITLAVEAANEWIKRYNRSPKFEQDNCMVSGKGVIRFAKALLALDRAYKRDVQK